MTEQHTNPLLNANGQSGRSLPAFIALKDGTQVPTDLYAYCDWLNSLKFWGRWHFVVEAAGELPRRVEVMQVDEATWRGNKARRFQGRMMDQAA